MRHLNPLKNQSVRYALALFVLLFVTTTSDACTLFSESEIRQIEPFNHLEAKGLVNVELHPSDYDRLEISASGIEIEEIISVVKDHTLILDTKGQHSGERIKVVVYYMTINSLKVSGAATVKTKNAIKTETLTVIAEEIGDASLELDVDQVNVFMKGHGNLVLSGTAQNQSIVSHGSVGKLDHSRLTEAR